ncbi:MAG TPA: dihydropteroate synthase [Verrucomicrobiales bacterium]|nr:dihydropteroate synthase [Verrucomicrobiales bacterium]
MTLRARGRTITFPRRPLIMGIVNINDDSFCGDGTLDITAAMEQARRMAVAGADIIDAGAESARTNREAIGIQEEIDRLMPFVERWNEWSRSLTDAETPVPHQVWPPLLSLNTWRPEVVAAILPEGGDMLNDIGALPDDRNAQLCAQYGAALLIMHSRGMPKEPHTHVQYPDIMAGLDDFFAERIRMAVAAGVSEEQLVLDPGIDFAKQREDNLRILRDCERLHRFGRPLLLPVSRKTVIGEVLDLKDPLARDAGTIACIAAGQNRGAHIFRVHHVEAAVSSVRVLDAILTH